MAVEDVKLQKKLIMKLLKNKVLGSHHLNLQTLLHGFARHEIGDMRLAVQHLMKKEYRIWYNRNKQAIQLNKERLEEIRTFLDE